MRAPRRAALLLGAASVVLLACAGCRGVEASPAGATQPTPAAATVVTTTAPATGTGAPAAAAGGGSDSGDTGLGSDLDQIQSTLDSISAQVSSDSSP